MLERMQIERMRRRLHGSDSSLDLLQEDDRDLKLLRNMATNFVITRQRDTATGAMVDRLTVKLTSQIDLDAFRKCDIIALHIAERETRYRLDTKTESLQMTTTFGFADVVAMRNERTAVV